MTIQTELAIGGFWLFVLIAAVIPDADQRERLKLIDKIQKEIDEVSEER